MVKCEICGKEYSNMNSLSRHVGTHMTQEEYYRTYMMTNPHDGECKICGNLTHFRSFHYAATCCKTCQNKYMHKRRSLEKKLEIYRKISKSNKSQESINKRKATNLLRYGTEWTTQNPDVQEKRKQTCLEKYGTECSWQAEEVKEKIQKSIHEHYGEKGLKSEVIREKAKNTSQERYGVDNPSQSKIVKDKIKASCIEHYGCEYAFQASEVKDKIRQSMQDKYDVEYASQSDEVKEKVKQTNLNKYNVECQFQRKEVRQRLYDKDVIDKKYNSYKQHNTFKSSAPEDRCYEYIKTIFPDVKRQYSSELYPFACDLYMPSLDLYIELNFFWTHGGHFFDECNENDLVRLKEMKDKHTQFYDTAIYVWTISDKKKLETALKNNLNYLVCWSEEEFYQMFSI